MAGNISPVTGIISEESVILEFGEHEGRTIEDIAGIDPDFYQRLVDENQKGSFSIRRHRDKTFRLYLNPMSKMDH